ncbi:MAG TPA: DUF4383 domain-containing protein [Gemmatimonadaceae bacterium]|nr:DUF4383 domain-containing protein [Gemmatimonadaceae bacterium]
MTTVQRVAQIFGVIFLIIGIAGFFFSVTMDEAMLLGMFPVNVAHNVVHLLFGIWGLAAARSFAGAKSYAQITGVIYLVLAVLGLVDPTGFGLIPIGGNDIWLHAAIGIVLTYFGFTASADTRATVTP